MAPDFIQGRVFFVLEPKTQCTPRALSLLPCACGVIVEVPCSYLSALVRIRGPPLVLVSVFVLVCNAACHIPRFIFFSDGKRTQHLSIKPRWYGLGGGGLAHGAWRMPAHGAMMDEDEG
jgi:hypothetical protein